MFDNVIQEVYWDEGHLNDYGNFMIADGFFESYVQKFVIDGSDSLSIDTGKDSKLNKIPITIQDILANYKTPDFLKQKIINLFT